MCAAGHTLAVTSDGMGEQSSLSPDPDKWLLVLPKAGENEEIVSAWVVDPSRKGQMMSLETSQSTYPQVEILPHHALPPDIAITSQCSFFLSVDL